MMARDAASDDKRGQPLWTTPPHSRYLTNRALSAIAMQVGLGNPRDNTSTIFDGGQWQWFAPQG